MDGALVATRMATLDLSATLDQAIADHGAGRMASAEAAYREILSLVPAHLDATHLLGLAELGRGREAEALDLANAAIAGEPNRAAFHNTRGQTLYALKRLPEAEAAYRTAWTLRPESGEIANNLACLLRERGDVRGAVTWLERAQRLSPGSAEIACNLGDALLAQGATVEGLAQFERALRLEPGSAQVHERVGWAFQGVGELERAEASYRTALRLRPDHAPTHAKLGLLFHAQSRGELARRYFEAALKLDPASPDTLYNLGCQYLLDNRIDDARRCYERALSLSPLHGASLWARCMVELPALYDEPGDVGRQRSRYTARLEELAAWSSDPATARALAAGAGSSQPFFLPYQGSSDRALQTLYGRLMARLMRRYTPPLPERPGEGEPIRIGFVCGFFCEHSVWRLILKGWIDGLDRNRFEVFGYHTGPHSDAETDHARLVCSRFVAGSDLDVRAAIVADRPHVLIYPELGMDRAAARLAAERLAPVQCVSWGQPQTSGLPTIDAMLSSALMEPAGAEAHYSEQLVRLPGLGVCYRPDGSVAESLTRSAVGARAEAVLFWCGQPLFKYLPQHDDIFARIAEQVPDSQFLFIAFAKSRAVTERFRSRVARAFAARGLDPDAHCLILEPMSQERFLGTIALADVMLDSIGWSGGKSTLDALSEGPVIVSQRGHLMRGRHTAAVLTAIGVPDTIADTLDEYVELAVGLARDPAWRASLRARVLAGRHRVLTDTAPVRALETILVDAVARGCVTPVM